MRVLKRDVVERVAPHEVLEATDDAPFGAVTLKESIEVPSYDDPARLAVIPPGQHRFDQVTDSSGIGSVWITVLPFVKDNTGKY